MIMQEKIKVMKKTNSEFVEFVSVPQKLHPFKNPHRLPTEPMGIHHNPHTYTIPIPMGIPMGIPIPTAALILCQLKLRSASSSAVFQPTADVRLNKHPSINQ